MSGEGTVVASNPSTPSTGGGVNPADAFQPATQPSNGGGGILAGYIPTCLKIENVRSLSQGGSRSGSKDILYSVKISLYRIFYDPGAYKGKGGGYRSSVITFNNGALTFEHKNGSRYEFDFALDTSDDYVKEAEFLIPASVYSEAITGVFTGHRYTDKYLPYCATTTK